MQDTQPKELNYEKDNNVTLDTLDHIDNELQHVNQVLAQLLDTRHQLFHLPHSQIDSREKDASESLYDEPSYNNSFFREDMSLRNGGIVEFHNENENYNPSDDDMPDVAEKKRVYRLAIMRAAQELGFIARHPGEASSDIDKHLGMLNSELSPIDVKVDVIVAGAAGKANLMRMRDTVRNIESGAVNTGHIILTGCDRPVGNAERANVEKLGYAGGANEYESLVCAAEGLTGVTFGDEVKYDAPYGENLEVTYRQGVALIGDKEVTVSVILAPFDPTRLVNGQPANRANTDETFLAAMPLLKQKDVLIESHDTWVPYQKTIAELTIGVESGKTIHATGPFKDDRLYYAEDGSVDIRDAQGVIDEITKVHNDLVRLRVAASNKLQQ